jgi:hypothetical protein
LDTLKVLIERAWTLLQHDAETHRGARLGDTNGRERELAQLHQSMLVLKLCGHPTLPNIPQKAINMFKEAFVRRDVNKQRMSAMQNEVMVEIQRLGVPFESEYIVSEGIRVDAAIPEKKIAIEVSGLSLHNHWYCKHKLICFW